MSLKVKISQSATQGQTTRANINRTNWIKTIPNFQNPNLQNQSRLREQKRPCDLNAKAPISLKSWTS